MTINTARVLVKGEAGDEPIMKSAAIERNLLVFSLWAVFGFAGLAFILEGFKLDSYVISLVGVGSIAAGFIGHLVVNAVFGCGFSKGEAALGIATFGVLAVAFIVGWADGDLSIADYWSGITLFALLILGLFAYLSARYGLRGAFSHLHVRPASRGVSRR